MGLCDYTGIGSSITGFACNAATGNLSQQQVDDIKAQATADVTQASAGRQPAVVAALINQVKAEIDSALRTFALPGEKQTDVGALPSQAATVRVSGTGNVTLATLKDALPSLPDITNLKYWIIGIGLIVGAVYVFPIIAPALKRNISAARSLA